MDACPRLFAPRGTARKAFSFNAHGQRSSIDVSGRIPALATRPEPSRMCPSNGSSAAPTHAGMAENFDGRTCGPPVLHMKLRGRLAPRAGCGPWHHRGWSDELGPGCSYAPGRPSERWRNGLIEAKDRDLMLRSNEEVKMEECDDGTRDVLSHGLRVSQAVNNTTA